MAQTVEDEGSEIQSVLENAKAHNGWFTQEQVLYAFRQWADQLTAARLQQWLSAYNISEVKPITVAIIMAGNVPLVGFHDFLCTLLTGHQALIKLASTDKVLLPYLVDKLSQETPEFSKLVRFSDKKLSDFDAVIATGSNNTARYFDYYFGKYPHIIRKNRNSVAVLSGNETNDQLKSLAEDIFLYFGLGCRNVSKLYLPKNYNFDRFFQAMYSQKEVIHHVKYMNNYDYNKAVYLMSNIELLDNEFMLLKEDHGFSSPIAVIYYEFYDNLPEMQKQLQNKNEQIQCVLSEIDELAALKFGQSQQPSLDDYADGVDTLKFLLNFP